MSTIIHLAYTVTFSYKDGVLLLESSGPVETALPWKKLIPEFSLLNVHFLGEDPFQNEPVDGNYKSLAWPAQIPAFSTVDLVMLQQSKMIQPRAC